MANYADQNEALSIFLRNQFDRTYGGGTCEYEKKFKFFVFSQDSGIKNKVLGVGTKFIYSISTNCGRILKI